MEFFIRKVGGDSNSYIRINSKVDLDKARFGIKNSCY